MPRPKSMDTNTQNSSQAGQPAGCAVADGSAFAMPQIPPATIARMKRLRRRRAVMKWLEKLPWFKR